MNSVLNIENFSPDKNSPVPLHLQLTEALLRELRTTPVTVGTLLLPSERFLVSSLKLDRSTVHRAYAELLERELVTRNPDKSLAIRRNARRKLQGPFPLIGLVLPVSFSEYVEQHGQRSFQYIKGIINRAEEREISIVMLRLPKPEASSAEIGQFIRERCEVLSGLIHLGDRGVAEDRVFREVTGCRHIPQIFISGWLEYAHIGSVCTADFPAAAELIGILRDRGIRRAGIVDFDGIRTGGSHEYHYASTHRMQSFREALEAAGIAAADRDLLTVPGEGDPREAIFRLVSERRRELPEFFWCINDDVADTLIEALEAAGVRVPEEVAVAGYDGYRKECRTKRSITSIAQPFFELGSLAVDRIMEYFDKGITEKNRMSKLPGIFIPGETIKP